MAPSTLSRPHVHIARGRVTWAVSVRVREGRPRSPDVLLGLRARTCGFGEKADLERFIDDFIRGYRVQADDNLAHLVALPRSDDLPTPEDRRAIAFIEDHEQLAGIPHCKGPSLFIQPARPVRVSDASGESEESLPAALAVDRRRAD